MDIGHNPSGRIVALGSTQPLTEMSTRNISWGGKGGRCVRMTNLPPSCAECLEMWETHPPGILWVCPGLYSNCVTLLVGDGLSTSRPGRFTPEKDTVPIVQEAGRAPAPLWTSAENIAYTGIRSPDRHLKETKIYTVTFRVAMPCDMVDGCWCFG